MQVKLIGDTHGHFGVIHDVLYDTMGPVIQLGDLGLGFGNSQPPRFAENFKFIRGNHDNPDVCRMHSCYLGDYGVWNGIGFVSGAWSIDQDWRTPGVDWWVEEELSWEELEKAIRFFEKEKPEVMISHAAPNIFKSELVLMSFPSKTENALQEIFNSISPKRWYCGHYHKSLEMEMKGTEFRCVNIDEVVTIKV